jgi:hypothetical protein
MRVQRCFKIAMMASALATCAGSEDGVRTVSPDAYMSPSCWFDRNGEFSSFLLVARGEGYLVPYPISGRCVVEPGQRGLALATVRQLGKVPLTDNHGALRRAFPGPSISSSLVTDQEVQLSNGRLYFFRARVTRIRVRNGIAYAPEEIFQLDDANMAFEHFLDLTAPERERLWHARRHGAVVR